RSAPPLLPNPAQFPAQALRASQSSDAAFETPPAPLQSDFSRRNSHGLSCPWLSHTPRAVLPAAGWREGWTSFLLFLLRLELLRVKKRCIQLRIRLHVRVNLAEHVLPVHVELHARRHQSSAQLSVVHKSRVARLVRILPVWLNQAHEQQ